MTLTRTPPTRLLPEPGQPFVVYAIWEEDLIGRLLPWGWRDIDDSIAEITKFSAANLPGAALGEFACSGSLAATLSQVHPSELPIALSLNLATVEGREGPIGEWQFTYLGQRDAFPTIWQVPTAVQPVAPTPLTLAELNQGAEDQIRESLGIVADAPIPELAGPLPDSEQPSEEPYRFDPTAHMDLSMAEAAPALPDPVAPGPDPLPGASTYAGPALVPTQDKIHGAVGDAAVPFAH